jgi:hypothetical protein
MPHLGENPALTLSHRTWLQLVHRGLLARYRLFQSLHKLDAARITVLLLLG